MDEKLLDALHGTMWVIVQLIGPAVLPAMAAGLLVGMVQSATGISESTLSFVPKLVITAATLWLLGSMLLRGLTDFTLEIYGLIPALLQ